MKTSKLHTLEDVLTTGIKVDGLPESVKISCIYIPKIQRAYAQGRDSEVDVRNDFLDALFEVLVTEEEKSIELSFLFGSKQLMDKRKGEGFELLDGQQRTTTLFLLYWYMGMKEKGNAPEFLSKFTYETRDTSIQFLDKITSKEVCIDLSTASPSKAIKDNKWFTDDFYCDPTVCAMLNMLDAIDAKYKKYSAPECANFYERLHRLRFYVLMLENFDMNDELYIKMNSRGLPLIPFENFKASIVKFMKAKERDGLYGTDEVVNNNKPFWFDFAAKIDAKWIDLFWKYKNNSEDECKEIINIDDKSIGIRFLNFFNRYLFTKSAIQDDMPHAKLDAQSSFFYNEAESNKMKQRFFGWEHYERMFYNRDHFRKIYKVLDVLHDYWSSFIKDAVNNDPFGNIIDFDFNNDDITPYQRVIFAAIIEFIEHIPEGHSFNEFVVQKNFKRMLRVVFNIMENTPIESAEPTVRVIKACAEMIRAKGATYGNFYRSLALGDFFSRNQQFREEIEKAKEMFSYDGAMTFDSSWEEAFAEAERHPFFKGSVLFFFTPRAGNSGNFTKRYEIIKELFDGNGVSEKYRKENEHILIRAIISQINYWTNGLENRYITEVNEREKYLKILLTSYKEVRKMICGYFDNDVQKPIIDYFKNDIIANAKPNDNEEEGFGMLFKRLVNDESSPALFDWIHKIEKDKKRFRIQKNRDSFLINVPASWYDRIILDTERHKIIPELIDNYKMEYDDVNQKNMMESNVKDSFGWAIFISKRIDNYKLQLKFNEWKWVDFFVYGPEPNKIAALFGIEDLKRIEGKQVKVSWMQYCRYETIYDIKTEIDRILYIMKSL